VEYLQDDEDARDLDPSDISVPSAINDYIMWCRGMLCML
jgi:hypothetical protein